MAEDESDKVGSLVDRIFANASDDKAQKRADGQAFADKLNALQSLAREPFYASLLEVITSRLPTTDDPENLRRIVLQHLFGTSLQGAPAWQKSTFLSSLVDDVFAGEENPMASVDELPLIPGMDGIEILRVFQETKNGKRTGNVITIVNPEANQPPTWGLVLHDIAGHVCDFAVEKKLIKPIQRRAMLDTIATFFAREHKKPTAKVGAKYKPEMDS